MTYVKEAGFLSHTTLSGQTLINKRIYIARGYGNNNRLPIVSDDVSRSVSELNITEPSFPVAEHYHPGGGALTKDDADWAAFNNGVVIAILTNENLSLQGTVHIAVGVGQNGIVTFYEMPASALGY